MTQPANSGYESRLRRTFSRQPVMTTLGASLGQVSRDRIEIRLPYREDLTQQHGFLHAGVVSTILDTACGLAALLRMPADAAVLAVEYKVNFVSPAVGECVVARTRIVKAGRTLTICNAEAFAIADGNEKLVATMLSTLMTVRGRGLVD